MKFFFTVFLISFFFCGLSQDQLFPVAKNGKWGLVDTDGNFILNYEYSHIEYNFSADKFIYTSASKKGLIDGNGKIISKPEFEHIIFFDSVWYACRNEKKWGLFNNEQIHFEPQFDSIVKIAPSIFLNYNGLKGKLYNGELKKSITSDYIHSFVFNDDLIVAETEIDTYDLINSVQMKTVIEKVDTIYKAGYQYAIVKNETISQLIDLQEGELIGEPMLNYQYELGNYFKGTAQNGEPFLYHPEKDNYYSIPPYHHTINIDFPYLIFNQKNKNYCPNYSGIN